MLFTIALIFSNVAATCSTTSGKVCSTDRTVFGNECLLEQSGKVYSERLNHGTVCSKASQWFKNECLLIASGATLNPDLTAYGRKCLDCDLDSGTVCSLNGTAYDNECALKFAGKTEDPTLNVFRGTCLRCNERSGPLCSTTGRFFYSHCAMKFYGLTASTTLKGYDGECLECNNTSGPLCSTMGMNVYNDCKLKSRNYTSAYLGYCRIDPDLVSCNALNYKQWIQWTDYRLCISNSPADKAPYCISNYYDAYSRTFDRYEARGCLESIPVERGRTWPYMTGRFMP